jgi:hypothetical protein
MSIGLCVGPKRPDRREAIAARLPPPPYLSRKA